MKENKYIKYIKKSQKEGKTQKQMIEGLKEIDKEEKKILEKIEFTRQDLRNGILLLGVLVIVMSIMVFIILCRVWL